MRYDRLTYINAGSRNTYAVQSALLYLKIAKYVALVEIAEDVLEAAARQRLDDVEKYLRRHGIVVGAKLVLHPEGSISDQVRNVDKNEGAD